MEDPGRNQVENILGARHGNGVAGVVATLVTGDDVEMTCGQIDDFSFAFVTPLGADDHDVSHGTGEKRKAGSGT